MAAPTPASVLTGYDWPTLQAGTPDHVAARADLGALTAAALDVIIRDSECHPRLRMMATAARDRLSAARKAKATDTYVARRDAARAPLAAFAEEV